MLHCVHTDHLLPMFEYETPLRPVVVMRKSIDTIATCHNIRSVDIKIDLFDIIVCFIFQLVKYGRKVKKHWKHG